MDRALVVVAIMAIIVENLEMKKANEMRQRRKLR